MSINLIGLIMQEGVSFSVYYGPGNINNQRVHIRALVDDDRVVYRVWSRRKGWQYHVKGWDWFELLLKDGRIKNVRLS